MKKKILLFISVLIMLINATVALPIHSFADEEEQSTVFTIGDMFNESASETDAYSDTSNPETVVESADGFEEAELTSETNENGVDFFAEESTEPVTEESEEESVYEALLDADYVYNFYITLGGVENANWVMLKIQGEDGAKYNLKFEKKYNYYLEPGLPDGEYKILSVKTDSVTVNVELPIDSFKVQSSTNIQIPCAEKVDNFFVGQIKSNWVILLILGVLLIAYFRIPKERREQMKNNGI